MCDNDSTCRSEFETILQTVEDQDLNVIFELSDLMAK
jgi:hypothetical protein